MLAEKALGKQLPPKAVVHHGDGNEQNDINGNLVICPNKAYHNLIHARMNALEASGNASWVRCGICKKYDSPDNLYITLKGGRRAWHRACHAKHELARWRKANGRHL